MGPSGDQMGPKWELSGTKRGPNGTKWGPNGNKWGPNGTKWGQLGPIGDHMGTKSKNVDFINVFKGIIQLSLFLVVKLSFILGLIKLSTYNKFLLIYSK